MGSWRRTHARLAAALLVTYAAACSKDDAQQTQAAGDGAEAGTGQGAAGAPPPAAGAMAGTSGGAPAAGATPSTGGAMAGTPVTAGSGGQADAGAGDTDAAAPMAHGPDAGDMPAATNGTGPGDWGPGDYPPGLMDPTYLEISGVAGQNDLTRQYKVHVPPSYDPDVPTPLLFCIHGLGQDAVLFCVVGANWVDSADEAGFILVMPNGYQNSWNGGTCCGGASASQLDEVALFRAILDEVGTHVNVDLDRVYATGLSNGGYMSYRLGCEAADIFAAVAPGAGAVGKNDIGGGTNPASDFTECTPSRPISVLDIHGTADPLVPYSLQAPSLARMAEAAGCDTETMPAQAPASGGDTTCVSYGGCPGGVEVTGCSVEGGGHCWFGSADCGTGAGPIGLAIVGANSDTMENNPAILDFFRHHSR